MLTLKQVFLFSIAGLAVLLALLSYFLFNGSQQSILESSRRLRGEVGQRVESQVVAFLDQGTEIADDVERELRNGLLHIDDRAGLEVAFHAQVLNHSDIAEVTLIHGDAIGEQDFSYVLAPNDRWEVSAYRASDDPNRIVTRQVEQQGKLFVIQTAGKTIPFPPGKGDPTDQDTFTTLILRANRNHPLWTDLYDSELPAEQGGGQRVEVSVQRDVFDQDHKFLGVIRIGLLESQLNGIIDRGAQSSTDDIPHTCFLCDAQGRLITALSPTDQLHDDNGDLRINSPNMSPQVHAALASPALHSIQDHDTYDRLTTANGAYLVTYFPFGATHQDWVLAVLGSEEAYLGNLIHTSRILLLEATLVMAAILICGALTLRSIQRGLSRVIGVTQRMRRFDFAPSSTNAPFRDVQAAMESLEQAKTAMRAMGKYVPMDLVRDLYEMNREPTLGGELRELSIMFTDIEGFTAVAESLPPDRLAVALGQYLEAMTTAIHEYSGTVDKFIGDSVMAIWNAPRPCPDHALKACSAALACASATRKLFASNEWMGMPPLRTRCGIHSDRVQVGHFGAPDRISYTALGDGVNLASRLEGLNKQYGTTLIVSQAIHDQVSEAFIFRLLDRVAVSGKKHAVLVYELLPAPLAAVEPYEKALQLYWQRDFAAAASILENQLSDPPSNVLAQRCRQLIRQPPSPDWDGVYSAMK